MRARLAPASTTRAVLHRRVHRVVDRRARVARAPRVASSSSKASTSSSSSSPHDGPLGLPITYHVAPPRPSDGKSTFGDAKCEPSGEELDTCTIQQSTEVYDRRCGKCGGNKLVMSTTRRGGRYQETISTCQACGGTGYVRVASSRVPADFEGGDSEAAAFEHFPRHDAEPEKKKMEIRRNIFADFEKQSSMKSMDEGSGAR